MEYLKIESNKSILVLNASYEPIHFTNWKRAIVLLLKNKAQAISSRVIRLFNYVKLPIAKMMAKPSRALVYKRDDCSCQYCGATKNLTIDHVLPRSRGGKDTWENMVVACFPCNSRKGCRTPEEANMELFKVPKAPINKMLLSLNKCDIPEWKEYIYV
jgi:5-methylcytosine-specific restriction endonuclease McrA